MPSLPVVSIWFFSPLSLNVAPGSASPVSDTFLRVISFSSAVLVIIAVYTRPSCFSSVLPTLTFPYSSTVKSIGVLHSL